MSMKTAISYPTEGGMGETGSWRVFKPVIDESKCIKCWLCWIYCPEGVIVKKEYPEVDYEYCKGCGVCANECPVKAIKMEREKK